MAKKKQFIKNKYGVKIELDLIKLGNKYAERVNKQREQKRNELLEKGFIHRTTYKGVRETVGERMSMRARKYQGETPFAELNSVSFNPNTQMSKAQAKRKVESLKRMGTKKYHHQQDIQYKKNLIESIKTKFGNVGDAELNDILRKVNRMSAEELADFYYTTEVYNIDFIYGEPEPSANSEYQPWREFKTAVNRFYAQKYTK